MSYFLFSLLGDGDGGGLTGVALLLSVRVHYHACSLFRMTTMSSSSLTLPFQLFISINSPSLMFIVDQGGTFLYVATVLQPVSHHSATAADIKPLTRVLHITTGIFIPYGLSAFLGHGH